MNKKTKSLTTAQFAKLHEINKRTLHYYDQINLFTPAIRKENGYRYYELSQSIDFEYILMLKELNMSIEEIEAYRKHPTSDAFLEIAATKQKELDEEIQKLKLIKKALQNKEEQLRACDSLQGQEIRIEEYKEEKILVLPYDFEEDDLTQLIVYIKDIWSIDQIRMGIGGFISLDKVYDNNFERYDGIFTPALSGSNAHTVKPKGKYLCGYQKGTWDKLSLMYEKMIAYAKKNQLKLIGYAYEVGMNEFAIDNKNDYVTKIMIKIEENL